MAVAFITLSVISSKDVKKQNNDTESNHTEQMKKDGHTDVQSGMDDDTMI